MKTIEVEEATDQQLDWLVAKCEGHTFTSAGAFREHQGRYPQHCYVRYPAQSQPILEREHIMVEPDYDDEKFTGHWTAFSMSRGGGWSGGPTMLIAGLRCYVTSVLGDEVEVPDELA